MLWHPLPTPILIFAIVLFISYAFKHRSRGSNSYLRITGCPNTDPKRVKDLIADHDGYSAELYEVMACTKNTVKLSKKYVPGDRLKLVSDVCRICVEIDGINIGDLMDLNRNLNYKLPISVRYDGQHSKEIKSQLNNILKNNIPYKAYMIDRNIKMSDSDCLDWFAVVIFFKIPGIPPTKFDIKF